MTYKIEQLVSMTRVLMNRYSSMREPLHCHDPDTLHLNGIIAAVMEQAAREVYTELPVWQLVQGACDLPDEICWESEVDGTYSGHIVLPDDYMRLHVLEMSDWDRGVYQAHEADTLEGAASHLRISGVRGTPWAPRCVISAHAAGRVLTLHSCLSDTATMVQGKYIALPTVHADGTMDISVNALHHVAARAASITKSIIART